MELKERQKIELKKQAEPWVARSLGCILWVLRSHGKAKTSQAIRVRFTQTLACAQTRRRAAAPALRMGVVVEASCRIESGTLVE